MKKKRQNVTVMHEGEGWRERMNRVLDIPPDLWPRGTLIEMRGQESVTVRGGGRILVYRPEQISMEYDRGVLSIRGRRLVCTSYYVGAIGIEGKIECVCFAKDISDAEGEGV